MGINSETNISTIIESHSFHKNSIKFNAPKRLNEYQLNKNASVFGRYTFLCCLLLELDVNKVQTAAKTYFRHQIHA